jgi:hypothetical protein
MAIQWLIGHSENIEKWAGGHSDAHLTPGNPLAQISVIKLLKNTPKAILCILDACHPPGDPAAWISVIKLLKNCQEAILCVLDACLMPGSLSYPYPLRSTSDLLCHRSGFSPVRLPPVSPHLCLTLQSPSSPPVRSQWVAQHMRP